MKKIKMILLSLWVAGTVHAQTSIPKLIHFQSVLTDDGGNPISDGEQTIHFSILDVDKNPLYEEKQTVESVDGMVSALIGNGIDPVDNELTGGLLPEQIAPDRARYLKVEVEGEPAKEMEITSVPFSIYSDKALSVAPASVTGAGLAAKSVALEHLADGVLEEIFAQMQLANMPEGVATTDTGKGLQTTYQGSTGAGQIGVGGEFVYSRGQTVQQVVKDLDTAINQRQTNIDQEKTDRKATNTNLQTQLTNETTARSGMDANLQGQITAETTNRQDADTALKGNINAEATARSGADTTLQDNINGEAIIRSGADTTLQGQITTIADTYATKNYVDGVSAAITSLPPEPKIVVWGYINCYAVDLHESCSVFANHNISDVVFEGPGSGSYYDIFFAAPLSSDVYGIFLNLMNGGTTDIQEFDESHIRIGRISGNVSFSISAIMNQ